MEHNVVFLQAQCFCFCTSRMNEWTFGIHTQLLTGKASLQWWHLNWPSDVVSTFEMGVAC